MEISPSTIDQKTKDQKGMKCVLLAGKRALAQASWLLNHTGLAPASDFVPTHITETQQTQIHNKHRAVLKQTRFKNNSSPREGENS